MKIYHMLLCCSLLCADVAAQGPWWAQHNLKNLAVVTVPVADLLVKPAFTYCSKRKGVTTIDGVYQELPLSGETTNFPCVRAHQALFNEIFTEARITRKECRGKLTDAWYGTTDKEKEPQTTFYAKAQNVCSLATLASKGVDLNLLPSPTWAAGCQPDGVASLLLPWKNELTGIKYSAGTRFKRFTNEDTPTHLAVYAINYQTFSFEILYIPRAYCLLEYKRTVSQQRTLFMDIIKKWLSTIKEGIVPYVLGGASFVHTYDAKKDFTLHKLIWKRTETHYPHTGLDCASLIWRAARMAGIPYRYKNTAMIGQFLTPLAQGQTIQEGDLLWTPGHVMIISSKEDNELIEAVGYKCGYGQMHTIPLHKRISGIPTMAELLRAHHANKTISLLNKDGVQQTSVPFKIYKLLKEPEA